MEFFIGLILGVVGTRVFVSRARQTRARPANPGSGSGTTTSGSAGKGQLSQELLRLSSKCESCYEDSAVPSDLLENNIFQKGVALMKDERFSADDCIAYFLGANMVLGCMAVEALAQRSDDPAEFEDALIENMNTVNYWSRDILLRTLSRRCPTPLLGKVLARVDGGWNGRVPIRFLQDFINRQMVRPFCCQGTRTNRVLETGSTAPLRAVAVFVGTGQTLGIDASMQFRYPGTDPIGPMQDQCPVG